MDVDRLQVWLDDHRLGRIQIREQARDFVDTIDYERLSRTTLDYAEGAALGIFEFLFALVLIIVVCIYMLLDMPRLQRSLDRRFPPRPGAPSLLSQVESSVGGYVKGQVLVSLIIGTSAGSRSGCSARSAGCRAASRRTRSCSARGSRSRS